MPRQAATGKWRPASERSQRDIAVLQDNRSSRRRSRSSFTGSDFSRGLRLQKFTVGGPIP
jgi:hypothetical protein